MKNPLDKLNISATYKEFIHGSFWSILGSIISKLIVFISWILIGRILGPENYGVFGIIRNTVIMFISFAGFGLGVTASKFTSEYLNKDKEKVQRIIGLTVSFSLMVGAIIGILVFILSPWIATDILKRPEVCIDLRITSLILFFSSLNGAQIGILQGLEAFKSIAIINIIQAMSSFPVFVIGAKYDGVRGAVIAFTFYNVIICILSHISLKKQLRTNELKIDYKGAAKEKNLLFSFSLPAFLGGLMVTPVQWYSNVMLTSIPNGYAQLGIFTAAFTFNSMLMMAGNMFDAPFLTVMARHKSNGRSSFERFNVLIPWFVGILLTLPFFIFPELGELFFGKEYAGDTFKWTFIIVLLFTLVVMYKQGLARILAVYNMQWWGFLSNTCWGVSLIISFIFLKRMGAIGLSISYLIAYTASAVMLFPIYYKKGLIPQHSIFSIYALILWVLIILILLLNIINIGYLTRVFIFIGVLLLILVLFKNYYFQGKISKI